MSSRRHLSRLRHGLIVAAVVLCVMTGAAWAYWTTGSVPGGNGAAAATSVNQGSTPAVVANGRSVAVSWTATTMANGDAVAGYTVQRYDASTLTLQPIGSGCSGTLVTTVCTETRVPAGDWVYAVTPRFATNWRGLESARSSTVRVDAPRLTLSATTVKPGTAITGQADGFLPADTLRLRLDSATGTELTGSLSGTATPAAVPSGGSGSVVVSVPSGTSDGAHKIYAVTSPSGESAMADILVDGTAPPAPVLTQTPQAISGDAATFVYTEAEAGATVECNLDGAAYAPCDNPTDYAGLTTGAHMFNARATDPVGNVSAVTTFTWTVNLTVPTVAIAFPAVSGLYNDVAFNAGCGTTSTGDVCGSADDDISVTAVSVSLRRLSTGLWWNGTSFSAATETWLSATGTSDWSYAFSAGSLPEGDFTLRARASDGINLGYDARTFTVDRTAPATPTLTTAPSGTTGPSVIFAFTSADPTAGLECRLDAGAWTSCLSPKTYTGLASGSHTVNVRAVDGAGNTSAATTTTWTVDATAPTAAMTFPTATTYTLSGWAAGCGTPATGDICGTADDVGSGLADVAVSIRRVSTNSYWGGSSFGSPSEMWLSATGTTSWSYLFSGSSFPSDGSYVVRWRATDAVGNSTTSAGTSLTLDTTPPPAPQIDSAPSDPSGASVQFDFSDTESGVSSQCWLDVGAWTTCSSPISYSGLAAGQHSFAVRATDAAGNVSNATSYSWTVDTGLPSASITSPVSGSYLNNTTYAAGCGTPADDICGTASDPGGGISNVAVSIRRSSTSLYWNGTSFSSSTEVFLTATGTTTWSFAMPVAGFPGDDTYTVHARATDTVGLTSIDAVTFTLDRTAPVAPTITSGPSGTTTGGDTFAFTGESGATFQCRLDAGAWTACTSPKTLGTLSDGSHTFDVRAVDRAGNAGSAASRTWTVDATAPTIGTTFPAANARLNNTTYTAGCVAGTGDICGSTADALSGVAKVEVSVQRGSTGLYLSGATFGSSSQNWITVTGTTSWNYVLAAATFPAEGTYTLVVRATDAAGNAGTSSRDFVIDRTKPTGAGLTTTNASVLRKLELNDTYTLGYSEVMDPNSIIAGWNGVTTQNVVVRATKKSSKYTLTVYNAGNTALLPLGSVNLGRTDYFGSSMTFGASGTASKLTMSGSDVKVTLGTPSGATSTAAAAGNMTWTPAAGATDLAGNACATTVYTENDNDSDF